MAGRGKATTDNGAGVNLKIDALPPLEGWILATPAADLIGVSRQFLHGCVKDKTIQGFNLNGRLVLRIKDVENLRDARQERLRDTHTDDRTAAA